MPDVPSEQGEQQDEPEEDGNEDQGEEDEVEDAKSTPLAEDSRLRARASPAVPQRRRPGRPPKRPVDWDSADPDRAPSETPKRRGGFRGGNAWRGGRWKNRGGQTHAVQVPLDKDGNMATVLNDEVELPDDPEGETKVDKNGYLKDGREYRVRTFTVDQKGDRLYMLSTEPARCIGFRDSYLFFQKHRQLYKIILSDDAKRDLIERDLIPHSYKGRAIGVVTARSVFREFGAKIIIGGRKISDDYQVQQARFNGDVEGELAVPEDHIPAPGEEYDRNRYVAWHGASAVYHSVVPTVPMTMEKPGGLKKRRIPVTGSNWMLEHARAARYVTPYCHNDGEVFYLPLIKNICVIEYPTELTCTISRFNSELAAARRQTLEGVYDIYTNQMHYPAIMQHTHAKWEPVPPPPSSTETKPATTTLPNGAPPPLLNGTSTSSSSSSSAIPTPPPTSHLPTTTIKPPTTTTTQLQDGTLLHTPPSLSHTLSQTQYTHTLTIDTCIRFPATSATNTGYPGPDGSTYDLGPKGLCDVDDELVALLPDECRAAFLEAREKESEWKGFWGTEVTDGRREGYGGRYEDEDDYGVGGVGIGVGERGVREMSLLGGKGLGRGSYNAAPI